VRIRLVNFFAFNGLKKYPKPLTTPDTMIYVTKHEIFKPDGKAT